MTDTLTAALRDAMDACWRAVNHPSVGQVYGFDNPRPKRPLALADVKHWRS